MDVDLAQRTHWIFDMDGTLTVAAIDFAALRRALDIPPTADIIGHIDALPAHHSAIQHRRLAELELDYAQQAQPQPGATELLEALRARGARLGILTRNSVENAEVTLRACGLRSFFDDACILGRESAEPKPSPAGVLHLLAHWKSTPEQAVMCGDFRFDLEAGQSAGTATVYVDIDDENLWTDWANHRVETLHELRALAAA